MPGYTDYCTCFIEQKEECVYFWDEIKDRKIAKQEVKDIQEAADIMQEWRDNAPKGVICEIIWP